MFSAKSDLTPGPDIGANKLGLRETLKADMRTMELPHTGILGMAYSCFRNPEFLAVFLYRLYSRCLGKGPLGKIAAIFLWRLNVLLNSCDIDPRAKIGEGFGLAHPMGIVIGPVVMGRNVEIYQNVTIGRGKRGNKEIDPDICPQMGDNVIIYTGAVVLGSIKIGNGARIGANAVVMQDVPENSVAVGVPARVITKRDEQAA